MVDADDFEEAVANGDIVLFGIEQICEKLSISRSSFIRIRSTDDFVEPAKMYFPLPDTMKGRSPKWVTETLNKWMEKAIDYSKRGINLQHPVIG